MCVCVCVRRRDDVTILANVQQMHGFLLHWADTVYFEDVRCVVLFALVLVVGRSVSAGGARQFLNVTDPEEETLAYEGAYKIEAMAHRCVAARVRARAARDAVRAAGCFWSAPPNRKKRRSRPRRAKVRDGAADATRLGAIRGVAGGRQSATVSATRTSRAACAC